MGRFCFAFHPPSLSPCHLVVCIPWSQSVRFSLTSGSSTACLCLICYASSPACLPGFLYFRGFVLDFPLLLGPLHWFPHTIKTFLPCWDRDRPRRSHVNINKRRPGRRWHHHQHQPLREGGRVTAERCIKAHHQALAQAHHIHLSKAGAVPNRRWSRWPSWVRKGMKLHGMENR